MTGQTSRDSGNRIDLEDLAAALKNQPYPTTPFQLYDRCLASANTVAVVALPIADRSLLQQAGATVNIPANLHVAKTALRPSN